MTEDKEEPLTLSREDLYELVADGTDLGEAETLL